MRIFQTDIVKLAQMLIPPRLRLIDLVEWAKAVVTPLVAEKAEFDVYREETQYWLGITPQVCYLEKALNDKFDTAQRRIRIVNTAGLDVQLIHSDEANKPVMLHTDEADSPNIIHDNSAYATAGVDFNVLVPLLNYYSSSQIFHMRAILDRFKLPDKQYKILHVL